MQKWLNPNRVTPRHIIIKDKDRFFKGAREKQLVTCKGTPIRLWADFSAEILEARKKCHDILKVLMAKNFQQRMLYLPRLSFRIEGEIEFSR